MLRTLDVAVTTHARHSWIYVTGELDAQTCPQVARVANAIPLAGRTLVVDLAGVEFMDSAALRLLLFLHRRAEAVSGRLVLRNVPDQGLRLLDLAGALPALRPLLHPAGPATASATDRSTLAQHRAGPHAEPVDGHGADGRLPALRLSGLPGPAARMRTLVDDLAAEAEQQLREHTWHPTAAERAVAAAAATELRTAIGPLHIQRSLPAIERLAHLREALAVLAVFLSRVHGRLAWFLGSAGTTLTPVLHWRALPDHNGPTFGAVQPTPRQYDEAEHVIRQLAATLDRISTT
ncbi:STAS domain-containing protein [Streptomyces bambusae]|uniref:STAS domain-containing protein n=1 Tax=Streptomyces bambusae TaxID=1550616 RepID=UPI001CFEED28|nr:STAS domain-containing protein [Streptomyces bambusae]MCB5167368.1 STAS domain-containing protein [Streptomyces bambusae]